ncbi:polyamine aminopropyltransferase [Marinibaculum pumilum]|uniref:Polyamine aminopropyltransferase n=1 Tax=Marinibaculum pumilum TaxID=1766165 RepID=A0ABV7L870_9PROT
MSGGRWIDETLHPDIRLSLKADRILYEDGTGHHHLALFENRVFGKVLVLDGAIQVTSADEFAYHEMMAHVPILAHGAVRDVMIVGGGDGGLAEEVLKHPAVERLLQVEIDASVVDFARSHFGDFNAGIFDDPRFKVEIADGAAFVARTSQRFDVILVDSTDPQGPGAVLFTADFYRGLKRCLKPGGVVVTQSGVPFLQMAEFRSAMGNLASVFATAGCYLVTVPTYFGGQMALGWAHDGDAKALQPPAAVLARRAGNLHTRYYTPAVHRAAFALPRFIADALEVAGGTLD